METRPASLRDITTRKGRPRSRLLAPLRYLRISAPAKARYDFAVPGFVTAVISLGYFALDPRPALVGSDGILQLFLAFFSMAVPFLFGALAAVAMGSPGDHLDRRAPGAEILLDGEVLTLRQFVCYLLGYLSFLGLVTLIAITASVVLAPYLDMSDVWGWIQLAAHFAYVLVMFGFLVFFSVAIFWALFFLTDVVNRRA